MDLGDRSLKSMMKRANRLGAPHVLIIGDQELAAGKAILRNMETKEQIQVPIDTMVEKILSVLK